MEYESFIKSVTDNIMTQFDMETLDNFLKSPSSDRNQFAKNKIMSVVKAVMTPALSELSKRELNDLATYYKDFKRTNYLNAMKATYNEEGWIYSTTMVELAICDYVIECASQKNETKITENVTNNTQKDNKKEGKFKKFINKLFRNDKEMGE